MIHETAIVDRGAELGADVSIGPFTVVEADTRIGDGCVIGPHVSILRYTTLGAGCQVHSGAVIGDTPQDLAFTGAESRVTIGSKCVIREGVSIHRGTKPGTETRIGDGCFLMGFSHYAHNVKLGANVIVVNGSLLAGYVDVGDRAFISGNVVVHQFVRIGRLAMLGGGCGVSKDVPPFCTVHPLAVNTLVGLNVVGLRRSGMLQAERTEIKRAFKTLFQSGLNVSQAITHIRQESDSVAVREMCDFIAASKRGICALSGDDADSESSSDAD
jgi:UDP-N-acetylglucosamine acyltransferase